MATDTQGQRNNDMLNNSKGDVVVPIADSRASKIRRIDGFSTQISDDAAEWDSEGSNGDLDSGSDGSIDSDINSEDEDFSDEEFSDDEEDALNEESLILIKRNDTNTTSLTVHQLSNGNINGEEAGRCIGDNTHLKKLAIKGESMEWEGDSSTRECFLEFAAGLARNRSIEHLSLEECCLGDGAAVSAITTLTPLFEHSINLHSLDIIGCDIGDESTQLLASSLLRRCNKSSFQRIILDANKISDESAGELIGALEGHHNLVELSLGDNEIGRRGCIALKNLLSSPKTKLKELNLENNQIGDDGIAVLTKSLFNNTALKELKLSFNCNITQAGWRVFSTCLQNSNSAIEKLDVSSTNIADEGVTALGHALSNNTKLKTLNCYDLNSNGIPQVTATGWKAFFSCLRNPVSALQQIDLRYSSIDEGGLAVLANALASNSTVKMLDLSHNLQINSTGWQSFFMCLESSTFSLEELHLQGNNVADEAIGDLTHALVKNETLETLVLGDLFSITNTGWAHFSHLLCDKSSITRICTSNHTLRHFSQQGITPGVHSLLLLNQSGSKKEVFREKILQYHFQNGAINIQEFLEMKLKVLPHAISWMGRNNSGHTLLYQLLRSLPSLFLSEQKMKASGAKRKMSCIHE
mmetsp:Transcript_20121/g.43688  ORF Transcript_20121/g.43688 Transcript_20121/m.43688 type:complete len:639 (+) Transcript_20121:129-2045(+)